jgi:hypothetical protein
MAERALINRDLGDLRGSLAGGVIPPDEPDYDAARRCLNALVDRRPAGDGDPRRPPCAAVAPGMGSGF